VKNIRTLITLLCLFISLHALNMLHVTHVQSKKLVFGADDISILRQDAESIFQSQYESWSLTLVVAAVGFLIMLLSLFIYRKGKGSSG